MSLFCLLFIFLIKGAEEQCGDVAVTKVVELCGVSIERVYADMNLTFQFYISIPKVAPNGNDSRIWMGVLSVAFGEDIRKGKSAGKEFFRNMLHDSSTLSDLSAINYFKTAQKHFSNLMIDGTRSEIPPFVQKFTDTKWIEMFGNDSVLGGRHDFIIQRSQRSPHCWVDASLVAMHYLVSMSTGECAPTLDVRKYILSSFRGRTFQNYLEGGGGDPRDVLDVLVGNDVAVETLSHEQVRQGWMSKNFIDKHGPIVISNFHVFDRFLDDDSYRISPGKEYRYMKTMQYHKVLEHRTHAMLIIGVRKTESGQIICLVQNWTPHAQFIQMSPEFLMSRGSVFLYVDSFQRIKELPKKFIQHAVYDESFTLFGDEEIDDLLMKNRVV